MRASARWQLSQANSTQSPTPQYCQCRSSLPHWQYAAFDRHELDDAGMNNVHKTVVIIDEGGFTGFSWQAATDELADEFDRRLHHHEAAGRGIDDQLPDLCSGRNQSPNQ